MSDHSKYIDDVKKYAASTDEAVVGGIIKHCGIALQSKDASMVSCTQKSELNTVREKFLKKKLGLKASDDELNAAIDEVCEKMGRSNPHKSRVTFYYLLAEKFGNQSMFA